MYTNEVNQAFDYEIIGTLIVDSLAFPREQNTGRFSFSQNLDAIFCSEVLESAKDGIPTIIPNKHAFKVKIFSQNHRNSPIEVTILVTKVNSYVIKTSKLFEGKLMCELDFDWSKINNEETDLRNVYLLRPVISHIFQQGDFLGVLIEGSEDAVQEFANQNFRVFRHGNKIYYGNTIHYYKVALTDDPTIDNDRVTIFGTVIASTTKIPSSEGMREFDKDFGYYIKKIYSINTHDL